MFICVCFPRTKIVILSLSAKVYFVIIGKKRNFALGYE